MKWRKDWKGVKGYHHDGMRVWRARGCPLVVTYTCRLGRCRRGFWAIVHEATRCEVALWVNPSDLRKLAEMVAKAVGKDGSVNDYQRESERCREFLRGFGYFGGPR